MVVADEEDPELPEEELLEEDELAVVDEEEDDEDDEVEEAELLEELDPDDEPEAFRGPFEPRFPASCGANKVWNRSAPTTPLNRTVFSRSLNRMVEVGTETSFFISPGRGSLA